MSVLSMRRGLCLVLAGPSGSGKSTVMQRLLDADDGIRQSVSVTTRPPRFGEIEGHHYFFRSQTQFDELVSSGGLLEHATVFGRSYGILRAPVEAMLAAGTDVLFVIDWQGYRKLREQLPGDVVGVFLLPPGLDELEARMLRRGDAPSDVAARMAEADGELVHRHEFDHTVMNDNLDRAVDGVRGILAAERLDRADAAEPEEAP
ncbi:MAG: guanylate kinase [Janthinobacterium lividum]